MATIASTLALKDKFTKTINRSTQGVNRMISSMERLNVGKAFTAAKTAINSTKVDLEKFIRKQDQATQSAKKLKTAWDGIKAAAAALGAGMVIKLAVEQTDLYANNQARLNLINDGMQTQAELQQRIYAAAQRSRGEYNAMVDSVSKLGLLAGDAFSSNNEMIAFTEQLNKAFTISGATTENRNAAMLQLTQAMAAGRLMGDEYVSIMENAPMVIDAISEYTGKTKGELKELSSEGYITADIIKNALFAASDDINKKFETMPKTFGSVATQIKNFATMEFGALMTRINGFLNSNTGAAIISGITVGISFLVTAITWLLDLVQMVGDFVVQHWGIIEPILWGVTAALLFWGATLIPGLIVKLWSMLPPIAAQAALWMIANYPIVLVGLAVAGLVMLLNHFGITADQVVGFVTGLFFGLGAFLYNLIATVANAFISFTEFFVNLFNHPLYTVKKLFVDVFNSILDIVKDVAGALDWVFGWNLAEGVGKFQNNLTDWLGEMPEGYKVLEKMDKMDVGDFAGKGYAAGSDFVTGIQDGVSGIFGNDDPFGIGNVGGLGTFGGGNMKTPDIGKVGEVGKINSDVNIADEDLQLMKDVAEMRYVQNFVTLTPTVAMNANVYEKADVNEVASAVADVLIEEVAAGAEATYA